MNEFLIHLESEQVKKTLVPIQADVSYTQVISKDLGKIVYGQDEACRVVGRRVAMFESGLSDPKRPMGVEFFLGPTGVGKTEMSHALAKVLFKDPNSTQLKILDCAEFHGEHTVARLIGSPPGYVGYGDEALITPTFLKNRNIIVFDEIEKADPRLHQILLGVI